jgi:hypothetical protein
MRCMSIYPRRFAQPMFGIHAKPWGCYSPALCVRGTSMPRGHRAVPYWSCWHPGNNSPGGHTGCDHATRSYHASVTQFNISQDYRLGANPTAVPDFDLTYIHGLFIRRHTRTELVIGVGDVDIRTEHVLVADFDQAASIDHYVTLKIAPVPDADSDAIVVHVVRPQPCFLCKSVIGTQLDQ